MAWASGRVGTLTARTHRLGNLRDSARRRGEEYSSKVKTLGWHPSCDCGAGLAPAVVLDPFVGSGTTCSVAQGLGRRGVGLDLNPEYLGIATPILNPNPNTKEDRE